MKPVRPGCTAAEAHARTLAIGTSYKVIGGNTASPTYYWIVVPGATPDFRWVAVTCGTALTSPGTTTS